MSKWGITRTITPPTTPTIATTTITTFLAICTTTLLTPIIAAPTIPTDGNDNVRVYFRTGVVYEDEDDTVSRESLVPRPGRVWNNIAVNDNYGV